MFRLVNCFLIYSNFVEHTRRGGRHFLLEVPEQVAARLKARTSIRLRMRLMFSAAGMLYISLNRCLVRRREFLEEPVDTASNNVLDTRRIDIGKTGVDAFHCSLLRRLCEPRAGDLLSCDLSAGSQVDAFVFV